MSPFLRWPPLFRWSLRARVGLALILSGIVALSAAAQQRPGARDDGRNFTGKSISLESGEMRVGRRHFEAGARTNWHVHPSIQVLVAEKGRGRAQEEGGPIRLLVPGQPLELRPGLRRWHGADPDQELVQLSVTAVSANQDWRGPVTDDVYLGRKQ